MRVLLIEDDRMLARSIELMLATGGFIVEKTGAGEDGVDLAEVYDFDLILLDLNLPDMSGLDVLRTLRRGKNATPILVLSGTLEIESKVKALSLGADDYLTKPFSPRTLLARVKALLRRAGMENSAPLAAGRIQLDVEEHTVQVAAGSPVRLTKLELRLLQMLIANAGHTVSSDRLLMQVWGHKGSGDRQLLKQLVHRLRQKIEIDPAAPEMLQTAPGAGYKLMVE
jgi:DNA-binding response OmpR family regulator